jgi:hypothetical protein
MGDDLVNCRHCNGEGSTKNMGSCYRKHGASWGSYTVCCVCDGIGVNRGRVRTSAIDLDGPPPKTSRLR